MSHIVTIDGPAMAGKTSTAGAVAKALGFHHVNTGAVYRALAVWKSRHPSCPVEANDVTGTLSCNEKGKTSQSMYSEGQDLGPYLYTGDTSDMASRISEDRDVRTAANAIIRDLCEGHDIIVEGRDTGSALFPDADLKIYLTANTKARVKRMRPAERAGKTDEQCADELEARDWRDSHRENDPMVQTPDMILVDNSSSSLEETVETICHLWRCGHHDR